MSNLDLSGWDVVEETQPGRTIATVKVMAHIRRNETGEVRALPINDYFFDGDTAHPSPYNWEEGNYSCDCNRLIFFNRFVGVEMGDDDEEVACTDGLFSVNLENPKTGKIYYREFTV